MILIANLLILAILVLSIVAAVQVTRLEKYLESPAWTYKKLAFFAVLISQGLGLASTHFTQTVTPWGLASLVFRLIAIALLVASYSSMLSSFKRLLHRLKKFVDLKSVLDK